MYQLRSACLVLSQEGMMVPTLQLVTSSNIDAEHCLSSAVSVI